MKKREFLKQLGAFSALGQQVVVDNRPGANGNIGLQLAASAPPDGYTVAIAGTSPLAINPF